MKLKASILILSLVFVSGCVQQTVSVGGNVLITMSTDPPTVFTGDEVMLSVGIENNSTKTYKNVDFEIFDYGSFAPLNPQVCEKTYDYLRPGEFVTFNCLLKAPEIEGNKQIRARVFYNSKISAVKTVEMISNEEYERRSNLGTLQLSPKEYSFDDGNIRLDIVFSRNLPLITNVGREEYVYLTFSNSGNGFVDSISYEDLDVGILQHNEIISIKDQCDINENEEIDIIGKTFPKITCKLPLDETGKPMSSYDLVIELRYNYEVRKSVDIRIIE